MDKITFTDNAIYIHSYLDIYSDINILSAGYEITTKDKEPRNLKDFTEFSMHCVTNGKGYYKINNKLYPIKKNMIFVLFPNMPLEYYPDKKSPWTYYWINFTGSKAIRLLDRIGITPDQPILNFKNPDIIRFFTENILHCKENPGNSDIISLANLYKIFSVLSSKIALASSNTSNYSKNALDYVIKNYPNPNLTIQSVATHLNISSAYLSRILKKETGMSFSTHLVNIRLKAASELIYKDPQATVTQIANTVGFFDPYYFSKVFKKHNNVTPSTLLKQLYKKTPNLNKNPLNE